MKLTTIWTIPAMTLRGRIRRTGDWAAHSIARKLPRKVRYWTFIHEGGRVIRDDEIVPEVLFMDLLQRLTPQPDVKLKKRRDI